MKFVVDTNVLLRDALHDDSHQAKLASEILQGAELLAIPASVFCEFFWVLRQGYKKTASEVAGAIRYLIDTENVVTNRAAVEAGLAILEKGGDFADGVIAYEGAWLGAEEFISFDKKAVSLLETQGKRARVLG
ncbi:MAG TPA: type II toxin-antitoxin system VapC family toxin [Terracidiphilus sp.]|nr:type II toxin-antitoxin system VapC family toxin [Terracidiphilus sp.]